MNFIFKKTVLLFFIGVISTLVVYSQIHRNHLTPEQFDKISINTITIEQISDTNGNLIALKNLLGNEITLDYEVNDIENTVIVTWKSVCIVFINEDDNPNQENYLPQSKYRISNIIAEKNNVFNTHIKIANKNFTLSSSPSILSPFIVSNHNTKKYFLFSTAQIPNITISIVLNETGTAIKKFTYDEF